MRMLVCCLALGAASLTSNISAAVAESTATAYTCTFSGGSSQSYANGEFKSEPVKSLSLEIADIDLDNQRASLITENGKGALRAIRAINANHFIEAVTEGYLNLTTIYDLDPQRKAHPAVHSRHFGLFGEPVVAQYTGFCVSK